MLKEYDVTRRNIHHNPMLKQVLGYYDTNTKSVPVPTSDAGPQTDVYGNTIVKNGAKTKFEYGRDMPDEVGDTWFSVEKETIIMENFDNSEDRYARTGDNVVWTQSGEEGTVIGMDSQHSDPDQAGGGICIVKMKNGKQRRIYQTELIVERVESLNKDKVIEKALNMGLSFSETKEILDLVLEDVDKNARIRYWMAKGYSRGDAEWKASQEVQSEIGSERLASSGAKPTIRRGGGYHWGDR